MSEPSASDRDPTQDGGLVRAAASGHDHSFRVLVERYQALVQGIAYAATGDLALAEDLTQEAFVIAWSRLGQLRDPEKFRSWLIGITRNVVRYERRQSRRRARRSHRVLDEVPELEAAGPSPLDVSEIRQRAESAARALTSLGRRHREALVLFHALDESYPRLASSLDISEATARQRVSRARRKIRDELGSLEQAAASCGRKTAAASAVLAVIQRKRAWAAGPGSDALAAPTAPAGVFMTLGAVAGALALVCVAATVELVSGGGRAEGRALSAVASESEPLVSSADRASPAGSSAIASGDPAGASSGSGVDLRAEVIMGAGSAKTAEDTSAAQDDRTLTDAAVLAARAAKKAGASTTRSREKGTLVDHGPAVLVSPRPLLQPTLGLSDIGDSYFFP